MSIMPDHGRIVQTGSPAPTGSQFMRCLKPKLNRFAEGGETVLEYTTYAKNVNKPAINAIAMKSPFLFAHVRDVLVDMACADVAAASPSARGSATLNRAAS